MSTVGTSRVVVRSLVAQWVDDVSVGTRVVITIAVSFARLIICWVSWSDWFLLFWLINDSIAPEKCFCRAWSEWRVISSGVCQRLFLFEGLLLLSGALVLVNLCA